MSKRMKGFWKRPVSRTYGYNLDVGQHYYAHHTDYLDSDRGSRGEAPGALTYAERLNRQWLYGRRYDANEVRDRYVRASSATRELSGAESSAVYGSAGYGFRGARAQSCTPFSGGDINNVSAFKNIDARRITAAESVRSSGAAVATSAASSSQQQQSMSMQQQSRQEAQARSSSRMESTTKVQQESQKATSVKFQAQKQVRQAQSQVRNAREEKQVQSSCQVRIGGVSVKDDMIKRVADARMHPWEAGKAVQEAESASAQTRMRISELERELEEITKKAIMTSTHASKTASALAKAAMSEDASAAASSYKKSKKVMIESSQKMAKA